MANTPRYNVARMRDDIADRGWKPVDLARAADVSEMAVSRFLNRKASNPRTALKLALALGYSVRRYYISARRRSAVA